MKVWYPTIFWQKLNFLLATITVQANGGVLSSHVTHLNASCSALFYLTQAFTKESALNSASVFRPETIKDLVILYVNLRNTIHCLIVCFMR